MPALRRGPQQEAMMGYKRLLCPKRVCRQKFACSLDMIEIYDYDIAISVAFAHLAPPTQRQKEARSFEIGCSYNPALMPKLQCAISSAL